MYEWPRVLFLRFLEECCSAWCFGVPIASDVHVWTCGYILHALEAGLVGLWCLVLSDRKVIANS